MKPNRDHFGWADWRCGGVLVALARSILVMLVKDVGMGAFEADFGRARGSADTV